uniref:Angiopoietin-like 4 n=1 Tax=Cynoglossus semilaevis TaxID=244447 RepID=A0A3P8VY52_CYNSE
MKTTLATLTLCLVVLLATGFPFERKGGSAAGGASKEKRVQYAAWDDVNVIAHGLLQLGQGLKEHVDKTKVQMRDISTKLKVQVRGLEDREVQMINVTAELREKAEEMLQEKRTMNDRMNRLEQKVENMLHETDTSAGSRNKTDAHNIQLMLEAQNKRIDDLMERIRLQQEKLDKQNMRIRTLQSQVQLRLRSSSTTGGPAILEQGDSPLELPSDCHELFLRGETTSGIYTIQPINAEPFKVFCEMTADGGWTVVQRRQDGSVDFNQQWQAYEKGFGTLNGEFWLGLEKIHSIAKDGGYVLNIKLSDWNSDLMSVRLPFQLGGEETKYSLKVEEAGAFGILERSLGADATLGLPFSTSDQDNDRKKDYNCAKQLTGGWWFSNCGSSNLNGRYFQSPPPKLRHQRKQSIFWKSWRGRYYPLKSSLMMVAPAFIQNKS